MSAYGPALRWYTKESGDITCDRNLVQQLFLRTLERDRAIPYVISEIKLYLKPGIPNNEALILALTKAAAGERDREENFSSKSKKVKGAVETGLAENSVVGKKANLLEKFIKKFTSMEIPLDALNLKQNGRSTRLLCKACIQNNLSDC